MAEKKIGGVEYRVDPLNGEDAYDLLLEIMRLTGPGAQYLPAIRSTSSDKDDRLTNIATFGAVSAMIAEFGVKDFVELKKRVIGIAQAKRDSGVYESVDLKSEFISGLANAEELFNFVIEVQFSDFFKGSKASGPSALSLILIRNVFQLQK